MGDPLLLRVLDEAEARQLPALIAEWVALADSDLRHWIARALRIDLALLTARPDLARAALHRRCAREGDFFASRPEPPAVFPELHAWAAAIGTRFLRSLRTPAVPLDGAVTEEYRTSLRGRLWGDGDRLGVAGAIAWDRATGRELADAVVPPLAPPVVEPWRRAARESTWGSLVLDRGPERITVAHDDAEILHDTTTVTDRLVLVSGDDLDSEPFHGVVDVRRGALLWRAPGACHLVGDAAGAQAILARDGGFESVALETGAVAGRWNVPWRGETVLLPDGVAAVRTGSVIRLWDLARATAPQAELRREASWIDVAEFSPDGTRLVTGRTLCDATTGAAIAELACNGPGWLEGGPPAGCQRLCDGIFVETVPWGLQVWSTTDGRALARFRWVSARQDNRVAYDPRGRHLALRDRTGLVLYALPSGARLRDLGPLPVAELAFSADGAQLYWRTVDGERWVVPIARGDARQLRADEPDPAEPPPRTLDVCDGVLALDDLAAPCDDEIVVVAPDGITVAGRHSHYRIT